MEMPLDFARFTDAHRVRRGFALLVALVAALFSSRATLARDGGSSPADEDERFTVIRAHKIITITGKDIEDGMIVVANGKVRSVGRNLEYPRNAKVIDARDSVVMPGLINPHSRSGLPRYIRNGVHSQLTLADEYIAQPGDFDDLLKAGYTAVALVPGGLGIPGRALVVRTGGKPETQKLTNAGYLKILADKPTLRAAFEKAQAEIDKVEKARKEFEEKQKSDKAPQSAPAQPAPAAASAPVTQPASAPASAPASQPAFQPPPVDPAHQGLIDLIQKKEGALAVLELAGASEVLHANQILDKYEAARVYLLRNGAQSNLNRVVELLGEKKARVIAWPIQARYPNTVERYPLIADLTRAGCEVSLLPVNDSGAEHARIFARTADLLRDGWTREDALKALTLNPARALGLESRFGSIEKDREADFVVLSADPLDPTVRVRGVIIAGELVYATSEGHE